MDFEFNILWLEVEVLKSLGKLVYLKTVFQYGSLKFLMNK